MRMINILILFIILTFTLSASSASAFNFYWSFGQPTAVYDTTNPVTSFIYGFVFGSPAIFYDTTASSTPTLRHYRWRGDNGTESSATYLAAEDTSLTQNIFVGDKLRLRILVSNTGSRPASRIKYRLEYSSGNCTSWSVVPTTFSIPGDAWIMSLSSNVADNATTTNSSGLTDPSGSFVGGEVKTSSNQTTEISLAASNTEFTELEYSIRSTSNVTAGTTYCFRVTNAGNTTNFSYKVQPQIAVSGVSRPTQGGNSIESSGSGTQQQGGGPSGGSGSESGGSGGAQQGGNSGGGSNLE